MPYKFRREDNGQIVEVDFETMMDQDRAGYIKLTIDGQDVTARRVHDEEKISASKAIMLNGAPPIYSDSLGCIDCQVDDFREDARKNGFTDINFVPDKDFADTGFYHIESSSPEQWKRYEEHRQRPNTSSKNGGGTGHSRATIERSKELVKRIYDRTSGK